MVTLLYLFMLAYWRTVVQYQTVLMNVGPSFPRNFLVWTLN